MAWLRRTDADTNIIHRLWRRSRTPQRIFLVGQTPQAALFCRVCDHLLTKCCSVWNFDGSSTGTLPNSPKLLPMEHPDTIYYLHMKMFWQD